MGFVGSVPYPAETAGVDCIPVKDPHETKRVIQTIIACLAGGSKAREVMPVAEKDLMSGLWAADRRRPLPTLKWMSQELLITPLFVAEAHSTRASKGQAGKPLSQIGHNPLA